ncbi:TPA: hypothetical protein DCW54_03400, partial [Candidatus Dependentiae bacterium]|nr:hypothetical protein [Candidatus Dependentiae bacterium]
YEVSSHLSNIIIGVDHVLKLNLNFAVEDLANFWNETFCEIYFKELGAKLGVSFIFKVQEKDSFMQVAFRLADQDLLIFSKEFLHIGILSMRNIMPFKLLKNDKEVSEIDYFTNFLETNGLPERRAHCRYPLSLFTGSWEDFDSKNKVRERFLSAHLKGLSFLAAISDQLACEMEPK